MSIFKRLKDLPFSNVYALIDKAEDPVKMIDQYLRNMQEDLEDAEKSVASQIALEKKSKQLYEEQQALVAKREEQAHMAPIIVNKKTVLLYLDRVRLRFVQTTKRGYLKLMIC